MVSLKANAPGPGGGIFCEDEEFNNERLAVTVNDCVISGNTAGGGSGFGGGGIFIVVHDHTGMSSVTITNSTISGNSANSGGAIYNTGSHFGGTAVLDIGNTILNSGPMGGTLFNTGGTVTSHGYNLSSDDAGGNLNGPGDQINIDPQLGLLQDNGGPTFTHALLPSSPAIDAGDPNFTPPPFFDQRGPGFNRVVNGRIDKGPFEVQFGGGTPRPRPHLVLRQQLLLHLHPGQRPLPGPT